MVVLTVIWPTMLHQIWEDMVFNATIDPANGTGCAASGCHPDGIEDETEAMQEEVHAMIEELHYKLIDLLIADSAGYLLVKMVKIVLVLTIQLIYLLIMQELSLTSNSLKKIEALVCITINMPRHFLQIHWKQSVTNI